MTAREENAVRAMTRALADAGVTDDEPHHDVNARHVVSALAALVDERIAAARGSTSTSIPRLERYGNAAAIVAMNMKALCDGARDFRAHFPAADPASSSVAELDDIERDVFRALDEMRAAMDGK